MTCKITIETDDIGVELRANTEEDARELLKLIITRSAGTSLSHAVRQFIDDLSAVAVRPSDN